MKTTPDWIVRLRLKKSADAIKADTERLIYLVRENDRLMNDVTRYQNVNNRLWNEMKNLPGGLEAARKVTL